MQTINALVTDFMYSQLSHFRQKCRFGFLLFSETPSPVRTKSNELQLIKLNDHHPPLCKTMFEQLGMNLAYKKNLVNLQKF